MKSYPVRVWRPSYRGSDKRKMAKHLETCRVASRVESYLNEELAKLPNNSVQVFVSAEVAWAISEAEGTVGEIIFSTDGGSNGITILKGDFEKWSANRALPPDQQDRT